MINLNFKKIKKTASYQFIHRFCIGCFCPWVILVFSFIFIMIMMSFFSISLHSKVDEGIAFIVTNNEKNENVEVEKIKERKLEEILKSLDQKKKLFEERSSQKNLGIIDPSL